MHRKQGGGSMVRSSILVTLVIGALFFAGCNHVPLDPEAEGVSAVGVDSVEGCKRLGKSRTKVLAKVLFVKRSQEKMARELATLARNQAVEMGGNAVVAESEVVDGRQSFGVYACPEPPAPATEGA